MYTAYRFEACLHSNRKGVHCLIRRMENHFKGFTVEYIERSRNIETDELTKSATHNMPLPTDVFFYVMEDVLVKTIEPELRLINVIKE
jgi:hypothetical protein